MFFFYLFLFLSLSLSPPSLSDEHTDTSASCCATVRILSLPPSLSFYRPALKHGGVLSPPCVVVFFSLRSFHPPSSAHYHFALPMPPFPRGTARGSDVQSAVSSGLVASLGRVALGRALPSLPFRLAVPKPLSLPFLCAPGPSRSTAKDSQALPPALAVLCAAGSVGALLTPLLFLPPPARQRRAAGQ